MARELGPAWPPKAVWPANPKGRWIQRRHGPIAAVPVRAEPSCIKPSFDLAAVRVRQFQSALEIPATLTVSVRNQYRTISALSVLYASHSSAEITLH